MENAVDGQEAIPTSIWPPNILAHGQIGVKNDTLIYEIPHFYISQSGAYADFAVVEAFALVPVPECVETQTGAAVMLLGMTAHYLVISTYPLKKGETALVHAAA